MFLQTGETTLHIASARGHLKIVGLLVKANAHVNVVDKVWKSMLDDTKF